MAAPGAQDRVLINVASYYVAQDPRSVLQPTQGVAEDFRKSACAPTVEITPQLRAWSIRRRAQQRNTITHKEFRGSLDFAAPIADRSGSRPTHHPVR